MKRAEPPFSLSLRVGNSNVMVDRKIIGGNLLSRAHNNVMVGHLSAVLLITGRTHVRSLAMLTDQERKRERERERDVYRRRNYRVVSSPSLLVGKFLGERSEGHRGCQRSLARK